MSAVRAKSKEQSSVMVELLKDSPAVFRARPGELVDGTVIFKGKNKLLVDLAGVATGIISGRELRDSLNTFKDLQLGQEIASLVLEEENDEGMVVLSLRMASQQKAWSRFHAMVEDDKTMPFTAQEANKGGLLANIDGIRTFLPVSQLAPVNYPRVNNADSSEIISRLSKFIGHTFTVKIITLDEDSGKIVVSEREAIAEERSKVLETLKIGDTREGLVSGIVKFGLFVAFDGLEGLVHISEIAWGHVKNPSEHASIGDRVHVKVIGIDGEKLSLSMKQLTKDPWEEIAERYPVGKRISGTVVRFADYGAFLNIERDITGLVHLTEIAHEKITDPAEALKIGQKVEAQVINIDIDERRIGLSIKALKPIDQATLDRIRKEQEEKKSHAGAKAESVKVQSSEATTEGFVASKSGKKYYPAESTAGKKISEANRVYFKTEEEAIAAGFAA